MYVESHGERASLTCEVAMAAKNKDIVQIRNPRSGHYVKIDRANGRIIDHKKSEGPYKNVRIARKPSATRKK